MSKPFKAQPLPEPIDWYGIRSSDMLDIMQDHLIEVTYNSESRLTVTLTNYCDHGTIAATADSIYEAFCAWARKYNTFCQPYHDEGSVSDDPDYPSSRDYTHD